MVIQRVDQLLDLMHDTQRVLKARMGCSRVYEMNNAQLRDIAQALQ